MGGYLGSYGVGDAQRERNVKRIILAAVGALVLVGILFLVFRNYPEKRQISQFLDNLQKRDFQAAYTQFGCTPAKPCRDYSFEKFMEDWGPKSAHPDLSSAEIAYVRSCRSGLVEAIAFPNGEQVPLFVQRADRSVGFAPYPYSDLTKKQNRSAGEAFRFWLGDLLHPCQ